MAPGLCQNPTLVSVQEHKQHAPPAGALRVAVLTVSDSRTEETDGGGRLARELCAAAGITVASHAILPDEPAEVGAAVRALAQGGEVDAVLLTGGTGISGRDTTVEAVAGLLDKTLDGYGELFRWLSYAEIGPSAMLSRAIAGTVGKVAVFCMPGSPAGVRLALEKLILPELAHAVSQLRRQRQRDQHEHHDHGPHGHNDG